MAKQAINVGTAANDKKGDSLRAAFVKVNANFTELYTALGLINDVTLNLGAFEFSGSTISTTDSTAIVIDQATTVTSNLSVGGDILPQTANGGDLGSSTLPWRSLYVSNNTIYIGGTSVGVDSQGNLLVGGQSIADVGTAAWNSITGKPTFATVATTGAYADLTGKPTIPTLVSQLSNDSGFLTSVSNIQSESDVSIQVNLTDSTTRIWRFGEDGSLTLPIGVSIDNNVDPLYPKIIADSGKLFSVQGQGSTGSAAMAWSLNPNTDTQYAAVGVNRGGGDDLAKVVLTAGNTTATLKVWKFDQTGAFTFPDNTVQTTAWTGTTTGAITAETFNTDQITIVGNRISTTVTNANLELECNGTGGVVVNGGKIILNTGGNAYVESVDYGVNSANSAVNIFGGPYQKINLRAGFGTEATWTFGTDGSLTLPGGAGSLFAYGDALQLDGAQDTGIQIASLGEGYTRLLWSGGQEVGNVMVHSGNDRVIITAGNLTTGLNEWKFNNTGVLTLPSIGKIVNNNKEWTFSGDGSLTLPGDIKSNGNINIDINLSDSTLRRWQFGEDGNLTFPDGTNYAGKDITLPQTLNGTPNKVSWNFSDIAVGSTTTSLEWNLLSSTFSEFLIGTSSAATPFYFNFDGSGQTLGTIDNGGIFGGGKLTFGSTAGNNAGDANAIELKATNGDVYLTSTESVKITVDASDSSARVWTFDPSGNLNVPGGIVAEYEEDFTISTSYLLMSSPPGPVTNTLTFAANGDLTVPDLILGTDNLTLRAAAGYTTSIEAGVGGSIEIGYQGDPPANIYIGTATAGYTTTVRIAGDRIRISADVPTSSKGQSGDIIGLVAFSSTHIYYCTASYDGTTDIWNRVALTGGVW